MNTLTLFGPSKRSLKLPPDAIVPFCVGSLEITKFDGIHDKKFCRTN